MIRKLLASKKALIVAGALVAGAVLTVPVAVFAATTPGGLLTAISGEAPTSAPESLDGAKPGGVDDLADGQVKPTESPEPKPSSEPKDEGDTDEGDKDETESSPKPKPDETTKPKPDETTKPKPKPSPDVTYQVEDPAAARAAFDAHRGANSLPAFASYNGNDCSKVGYAAAKSPVGSAAPSAVIISESGWLVLSAADEGRITTAKVNGWYDEGGRWRVDLAVYDCAA